MFFGQVTQFVVIYTLGGPIDSVGHRFLNHLPERFTGLP